MHYHSILRMAAISGAVAVALGALGAHTLKPLIEPFRLTYFEKAVQYQFVHTLALLGVACIMHMQGGRSKWLKRSAWGFLLGILCFSGSLYGLAIVEIVPQMPTKILGPITPLGGLCYMFGWVALLAATFGRTSHD